MCTDTHTHIAKYEFIILLPTLVLYIEFQFAGRCGKMNAQVSKYSSNFQVALCQNTFLLSYLPDLVLSLPRLSPPNMYKIGHFLDLMSLPASCPNFILYLPLWKQRRDMTDNAAAFTLCRSLRYLLHSQSFVHTSGGKHNFISIWILQVD